LAAGLLAGFAFAPAPAAADVGSVSDLSQLSIEELANVPVTSVSKSAEPLSDAAAAIYVISHDDIRRSGATTLPEILRLAPNLEVAQVSGSGYAITARGFNGTTTANGAGNKLLVLIDGRTVYTPLYGGVFWDLQNVLPEDIDRIEVISGPGAALWGANAVNGVINIITRNSGDTQGLSLSIDGGSLEYGASAQFGGAISPDANFRIYAQAYDRGDDETTSGAYAHDSWDKLQTGFRIDWHPGDALVTFQGDAFTGREEQNAPPNAVIGGANLVGRWTQPFSDGSSLQVQGYYDYNTLYLPHSLGDALSTFDLDIQHSFSWGAWNDIVWGGGARIYTDRYSNTASIQFLPPVTTQSLENVFFQDTISVSNSVKLILGSKLEDDPFVGLQPLPSARISWKASGTSLLWAAVSRAVRAPTLWDRDLNELVGGNTILGSGDFQSEKLVAFEAGYRAQPMPNLSFSVSTFYNMYTDLRSFNFSSTPLYPFVYGNSMYGDTYGAELWGSYRVTEWWLFSAGFNVLEENLKFKSGNALPTGTQIAGNDPSHQVTLKSSWDLPHDVEFDIDARYIAALPDPAVPAYWGLDARVGWQMTDRLELALSGTNLAGKHTEFGPIPGGYVFGPTVLVALKWKP
jgi:iron complex outermembrane receptor protein